MDNFKFDIKGMKQVEDSLMQLGDRVAGKTLTSALRDAAKPVHSAMLANAPVGDQPVLVKDQKSLSRRRNGGLGIWVSPGEIKRRIKIRSVKAVTSKGIRKSSGKGEVARVRVGVFRAYYAYFQEFGTKHQAATPFIRPAIDSKSGVAIQTFNARIRHQIKLAEKRLARKSKKAQT